MAMWARGRRLSRRAPRPSPRMQRSPRARPLQQQQQQQQQRLPVPKLRRQTPQLPAARRCRPLLPRQQQLPLPAARSRSSSGPSQWSRLPLPLRLLLATAVHCQPPAAQRQQHHRKHSPPCPLKRPSHSEPWWARRRGAARGKRCPRSPLPRPARPSQMPLQLQLTSNPVPRSQPLLLLLLPLLPRPGPRLGRGGSTSRSQLLRCRRCRSLQPGLGRPPGAWPMATA